MTMCIFGAILQKIQLSLSELKRLDLHSRLRRFAQFFFSKIVSNPTYRRRDPSRTLPHSALRASRTPPGWILDPPLQYYVKSILLVVLNVSVIFLGPAGRNVSVNKFSSCLRWHLNQQDGLYVNCHISRFLLLDKGHVPKNL